MIAGRRRRRRELVVKSCYRVVPEVAETEERVLQVKHVEAVLDILLCHGLVALHDQAPGHRNRAYQVKRLDEKNTTAKRYGRLPYRAVGQSIL